MNFSRRTKDAPFSDLISEATKITGDIKFAGYLKIEGEVTGNIIYDIGNDKFGPAGNLTIGAKAKITSNIIDAANIILGGNINVNKVVCTGLLQINKDAVLNNVEIYYNQLQIEPGATLNSCMMHYGFPETTPDKKTSSLDELPDSNWQANRET